ncbi:MAG: hypothetical protein ONB44_18995 [candidate division KSB1 bacterium]|nr:hypothetical protein [candidate division KSB1 bacterium]MDZ7304219.1 hypothetical protein [candidate division KSB1 bacterium]MDZ7311694.1 hypothetical protein [candidate division KSB1 bacterium]
MPIWTLPTALQARINGWLDGAKERPAQNGQSISYYLTKSLNVRRTGNGHWHEVLCATDFEQKICKMADRAIRMVYEKWQARDAKLIGEQKTWYERLRQAEENYLIRKRELERDATFASMPWWYFPMITIFGIAELAMNAQVFDIFGSARFETIIMALILSFAIPVSGHFWGRFLREDEKEKPLIFLSIGCLGVIIFSLYSLAAVRNSYFKSIVSSDAETIFNAWLFFLSLNFLIFLIAIYASWYAHERDFKLFKFKRDFMAALAKINKIGSTRNALKASCHNQIFRIRDAAHERISIYRQHNMRKRSDDRRPLAFESLPDILIPEFEEESFATNGKARSSYLLTD